MQKESGRPQIQGQPPLHSKEDDEEGGRRELGKHPEEEGINV